MYNANSEEQKILDFWSKDNTFEKSVSERPENKPYVFYDGPPFATGLPHYGHILSSVIKDVVPRYWTMKGYRVRRRWGWDCHGLPIENIVEKETKISGKKEIAEWGIEKFNETCRSKVLMYTQEWKKMVTRIGRWVEFDNSYKTMDSTYMESVWWAVKTIWDKGLIYEGRKVLMYCPRCETPVSKAEIAMDNSYKDVTEESVIVKFQISNFKFQINSKLQIPNDKPAYILAWTTTPWTLPGNVALAVGAKILYSIIKSGDAVYILASDLVEKIFSGKKVELIKEVSGDMLVGLEYEPLFDVTAVRETGLPAGRQGKKAWYVAPADFVATGEGTGVVHTAVIYGEDDYNLGVKLDLPMVPLLDEKGHFNESAPELIKGKYFKQAEKDIKNDLETRGLLFSKENLTHSYPFCWRCDTQLFYNAISAWFINIQKVKARLLELNEKINWYPEYLKHGRFQNIIETAPDWNISRNRYWATPLPFWKHVRTAKNNENTKTDCDNVVCIGSVDELKKKAVNFDKVYSTDKVEEIDLHKHLADQIKLKCDKCGGVMERIPEVIDCWVESASMPFAEFHYPFENVETFKQRFPGQYIAEYIAQTRAWFYYMHAMAGLLFDDASFTNCVTTGTILNEKGDKLSKSKMNFTDPWKIIELYGVDALRFYLMTSPVMEADDLLFSDREVRETYNKVINILWNVVEFYTMYAGEANSSKLIANSHSKHILDRWIMAKLHALIKEVTENMDNYNTVKAGRPIKDFIDDLSTWYVRRSRDRFKGVDEEDKNSAIATLWEVLITLSKLMAPFAAFIAERIWQTVGGATDSVHLQEWPKYKEEHHQQGLLDEMSEAKKVVELGLSLRAEQKIRVRQPLSAVMINKENLSHELLQIVADELNVKKVELGEFAEGEGWVKKEEGKLIVWLNTTLTDELKKEGLARELVRAINQQRKDKGFTINDRVAVYFETDSDNLRSVFELMSDEIKRSVLADIIEEKVNLGEAVELDGQEVKLALEKK